MLGFRCGFVRYPLAGGNQGDEWLGFERRMPHSAVQGRARNLVRGRYLKGMVEP
jgi:hypothetical protein